MTQQVDPGEVIGFGAGREHRTLRSSVRAHPWLAAGAVVLLALGVGAVVAIHRAGAPDLPDVTAAKAPVSQDTRNEYPEPFPWTTGNDGRPKGPVVLHRETDLHLASAPTGGEVVELFGLSGPGVTLPATALQRLEDGRADTTLTTDTTIDCSKVPSPVPPSAYGLAVRVQDGGRTTTGVVGAGKVGEEWARGVQAACGSWIARTAVTVSAATVTPDATRPRARVALTFTNAGDRAARIRVKAPSDDLTVRADPPGPIVVPAHGQAQVTEDLTIATCDSLSSIQVTGEGTDVPVPVLSDQVGVTATAGTAADLDVKSETWADGFGPTGLLFAQPAAEKLSDGLRAACGGIRGFAVLVAPNGTTYDKASRTLDVRVLVDTPPGVLHDLRLIPDTTGDPRSTSFVAVSGPTARLVPDRTGQVATTLQYEAPRRSLCPSPDLFLPGFTMVARVPAGDTYRTVRFTHFAVQWEDAAVRKEICGSAG